MDLPIFDLIFSILLFVFGLFSIKKTLFYIKKGKVVEAVVKEVYFCGEAYHPTVEFNDVYNPGEVVIRKLDFGSNEFNYEIGSKIKLIYYKDEIKTKLFVKSWLYDCYFEVCCTIVGFLSIIEIFMN